MNHGLWGLLGHWDPHTKTLAMGRQWGEMPLALSPPLGVSWLYLCLFLMVNKKMTP